LKKEQQVLGMKRTHIPEPYHWGVYEFAWGLLSKNWFPFDGKRGLAEQKKTRWRKKGKSKTGGGQGVLGALKKVGPPELKERGGRWGPAKKE